MALRLEPDKSMRDEVERILRGHVEQALEHLEERSSPLHERVHTARQSLKKARAAARLIRARVKKRRFRELDRRCRDAGRVLSDIRDAHVLRQTGRQLLERFENGGSAERRAALERLVQRLSRRLVSAAATPKQLHRAARRIARALDAAKETPLSGHGWKVVESGIARTYDDARCAYQDCLGQGTAVAFHDWRKETKHVRYHVELLCECKSPRLDAMAANLHRLSDLLGELHDLDVFLDTLVHEGIDAADLKEVESMVESRRSELRAASLELGSDLFSAQPHDFVAELHAEWQRA